MNPFLLFLVSLSGFTCLDFALQRTNVQGIYYFVHALHNALIVYTTLDDVILSFTTPQEKLISLPSNTTAIAFVFALHVYHILMYWKKFRYDDWLHHSLMIGIALPIGCILPAGPLMGMSLFFTTGLPGGLDYVFLFAVRNGKLNPLTEKRINSFMNVWIRAPGAIAQGALTLALTLQQRIFVEESITWLAYVPAVLNYWNGCYFMEQVVTDYTRRTLTTSL